MVGDNDGTADGASVGIIVGLKETVGEILTEGVNVGV